MATPASRPRRAARQSGGNKGVVGFALVIGTAFFSIPFLAHFTKTENLTRKEDALNASQIRRGVYLNTGSKDAGVDPDWDFRTNTWRGRRAGDVVRKAKKPQDESGAAEPQSPSAEL
uniref:Uncharacterized protein n=1 Tax=Globisporangium ultimum (strain ATCC 200006 / CBS 805.95 / DAOM BR144) TaxID=431595 RepID=K3XCC5_GLOUD